MIDCVDGEISDCGQCRARAATSLASADDRRRSTPTRRAHSDTLGAGTRAQRFLAPTSYRVIRALLITPIASVRLEDVAKRIP
jgi:hypothetical protein